MESGLVPIRKKPMTHSTGSEKLPFTAKENKVYIANFGEGNSLWPQVKANNSIATFSDVRLYDFWENDQKDQFVDYVLKNTFTACNIAGLAGHFL